MPAYPANATQISAPTKSKSPVPTAYLLVIRPPTRIDQNCRNWIEGPTMVVSKRIHSSTLRAATRRQEAIAWRRGVKSVSVTQSCLMLWERFKGGVDAVRKREKLIRQIYRDSEADGFSASGGESSK